MCDRTKGSSRSSASKARWLTKRRLSTLQPMPVPSTSCSPPPESEQKTRRNNQSGAGRLPVTHVGLILIASDVPFGKSSFSSRPGPSPPFVHLAGPLESDPAKSQFRFSTPCRSSHLAGYLCSLCPVGILESSGKAATTCWPRHFKLFIK